MNGKFDNQCFSGIVVQMGMIIDQYVQVLCNQLIMQQLINVIVGIDFMLLGEFDQLVVLVFQQWVVCEVIINVNVLVVKQIVSDEEINVFWQQNQVCFMVLEQFCVSYIKMDVVSMQESVFDDEIQLWYDQYKDQFIQLQCNCYSVIQIKIEVDVKVVLVEL